MADTAAADVRGEMRERFDEVLTPEALAFVADLQKRFGPRRKELLEARRARREEAARTGRLDFLDETKDVRDDTSWHVAPLAELQDRRVEITGPTERKMLINALNSGAKVFMADFEDASTPTWVNKVQGQINLTDAIERRIDFTAQDTGKEYKLKEQVATLMPRPRGWHLPEKHVLVDGEPMSGGLFDFGMYFFHNAKRLLDKGGRPYFYLPKMESHLEARLWNDVFVHAQQALDVPVGTIRATVLIETIPAAFQMDEILYELRDHSYGLNAGRWDYMFSMIKTFRDRGAEFLLPDRNSVTMTVPFMHAYTELLVQTCHKRGAFAMGGMAAFIPSKDPELNKVALEKVQADKAREAKAGFDGSWVAHPGLVETAMKEFDAVLGEKPNQIDKQRPDVNVTADDLLAANQTPGEKTSAGLRTNVDVGIRYIESWLRGNGAAAIHNLMEDAATAEISRSQVWQWVHNDVELDDTHEQVTAELVRQVADSVMGEIREEIGGEKFDSGRWKEARDVFEEVALADDFVDFLTLPAYERID